VIALRRGLLAAFVVGLGLSITLAEGALICLTLLWLWRLRDPQVRHAQQWPLWRPVLAFTVASLLSAFASGHADGSLIASKTLLLALALYVTADALVDAREGDRFVSWLALSAVVAALAGLVQVAACPVSEPAVGLARWFFHRCDRARAFFSIYMTLAGVLNIVLLATLPRVLPGGFRSWSAPVWLVTSAGLAMTYTRGAWLGLAAGAAAFLPMSRRSRWALLAILVLLPTLLFFGPRELSHRFRSMSDPDEAGIKERVYMWRSGVSMWREHPLLGWGPGGVKREYTRYALPEAFKKRTGHVHNTPLQILVERGVLGLAAWLTIWIAFYRHAIGALRALDANRARERALVAGSIAAVTGFLVAGLSEYNFGDSEVVMVAWAVMALPWATTAGSGLAIRHLPPGEPE
jgi:putative inorganic carbon (HCO3(-)) transporter